MSDEFITAGQIRAARAILDLSPPQLCELANVSLSTLRRLERNLDVKHAKLAVIQALKDRGVVFIKDGIILKSDD
jgi:DNA-binding transcriptional regulator YiaG